MKTNKALAIFLLFVFFGCQIENRQEQVGKFSSTDEFKNTMVESQFFSIDNTQDNVIESKNGNLLIVPEEAFLDKRGNPVEGKVDIEYAEASDMDELLLSNLQIQGAANQIVETKLAFFINASFKGEQVQINPSKPVYIEIDADEKINLYKTSRDKVGNMKLETALETVKYLTPVPLESLNFLPPGFEQEVEKGLPFGSHEVSSKKLVDSLYYSLVVETDNISSTLNKPAIYPNDSLSQDTGLALLDQVKDTTKSGSCGINPASIKAIKHKKFENTLIATREFESRLKSIFATCNNSVLELYVNNLDKNLWEIDEMVAEKLGPNHELYPKFEEFASYKQTKVELSNKRAAFLAKQFQKQKQKIEKEIRKLRQDFLKQRKKQNKIAVQKRKEYAQLLKKREKYRMNKFGFELTEVGWYNAAEVITLDDLEKFDLNVKISNGDKYDRVYTYVINPKIKSIFSWQSDDNVHFDKVFYEDPHLLLWKNQKFKVLAVGYKGEDVAFKIEEYEQKPVVNVDMELVESDRASFKKKLKKFTRFYKKENKISVDLEYQESFYKDMKRREKEMMEDIFIQRLRKIAFPCCDVECKGRFIFIDTKLRVACEILEKCYGKKFIFEDEEMYNQALDMTFGDICSDKIAEIFTAAFAVSCKKESGAYIFMRGNK